MTLTRRTPLRPVSRKRRREQSVRTNLLRALDAENAPCEARLPGCQGRAVDCHEVMTRGRGGGIIDPAQWTFLCRHDHDVITEHPWWALRHGWVVGSWAGPAEEEQAWKARTTFRCSQECTVDHVGVA